MTISAPTIPGIHGYGLLSARPTAGQIGAHYYATDTQLFYRDNGTTWDTMTIAAGAGGVAQLDQRVLSTTAASITFASISAGYSKLVIDLTGRSDTASTVAKVTAVFNSDTAAHYDFCTVVLSGGAVAGAETGGATSMEVGFLSGASSTTGNASSLKIELPNYAGTTLQKSGSSDNSLKLQDGTGSQHRIYSLWWRNTAAINNIVLTPVGNFVAGTVATLYGFA